MRIVLLKEVKGADRFGNTFTRSTVRFSRGTAVEWRPGVEMEVSEATGAKMIAAGQAKKAEEVKA